MTPQLEIILPSLEGSQYIMWCEPFLFQSALARLLGFKNLKELVEYIDSHGNS